MSLFLQNADGSTNTLVDKYFGDIIERTAHSLAPLYHLDAFDWVLLVSHFTLLTVLALYGAYRIKQVFQFWRYRKIQIRPTRIYEERELPRVTVQLPIYNELYVVERLIRAVTKIDYPRASLEIQVLDDSTDETRHVAEREVERYRRAGFDIHYIHRDDRTGFKAGALENGMNRATGDFLLIFDADFVPKPDCVRKMVHYFNDPLVACVQMRWSHINASYNLLTRLQTILIDGHFVIEQTVRNRAGGFFNFNGTAGIWRKKAIEGSGGWQHDTLTEDTDLSFRAQLMGWQFVYLLDEDAPAEVPVEVNAFKAQQRRWAKGVAQVGLKLYPRIWRSELPMRVKLEMFFRMTGSISYPLMIVASVIQFPLLMVRYNQGFYHLMLLDAPLLVVTNASVLLFYGTAIWYLRKNVLIRWLHLPLVMSLGIGLAFSNARAVLEALLGVKSEFVRTPKYQVEKGTDGTWKSKKYHRKRGWLPALELAFAVYFLGAIWYAARMEMWGPVPFLLIFFFGYGYMGWMGMLQTASVKRFFGTFKNRAVEPNVS